MNPNREEIAQYIYEISFHANNLFYEEDGSLENYKPWNDILDIERFDNDEILIKEFYFSAADYFIKYYCKDIDFRMLDEILESTSIFFSKVHSYSLPIIHITKEIEFEEFGMSLFEKSWNGNNWKYLVETATDKNEVDKSFFRRIGEDFLTKILKFDIPKPVNRSL